MAATSDVWESRIDRMRRGESGWAPPTAVSLDLAGQAWLSGGYALSPTRTKAATMRVEFRQDGFHITPPKGYKWEPRGDTPSPSGAYRVIGVGSRSVGSVGGPTPRRRPPPGGGRGWGDGPGPDPRPIPPPPENEGALPAPPLRATVTEVPRQLSTTNEDDKLLPEPARPKKPAKAPTFTRGERT